MERSKIDSLELRKSFGIDAISAVICPIPLSGLVEKPFIANSDEVQRVQTFDVCANFFYPFADQGWVAVRSSRKVPDRIPSATRFVSEFPGEYRRRVLVPCHYGFDVFLESRFDLRNPVKLRSSRWGEHPCTMEQRVLVHVRHHGIGHQG